MKILQQHFSIRIFYFLYYFSFLSFHFHPYVYLFFILVFLLHTRVQCPISSPQPFFYSLFLPHSRTFQRALILSPPVLSLSLSLLLDFRTFTSSLYDKKRKKRGIERKKKIDGSLCRCSSSSPTQSRWVRWLLSFFFFLI